MRLMRLAERPHDLKLTVPRAQRFDNPAVQLAFDAAVDAMLATVDRRDRLDRAIAEMAADSEFSAVVTRLGCLRGISTLTAFALAVEIGDWDDSAVARSAPTWGWCPPSTPQERPAPRAG